MDEKFQNAKLLGWIEIMKNPNLKKAINKLSEDEQVFITYLLFENYTQQELADKYNVTQPAIYHKINEIKRKIKSFSGTNTLSLIIFSRGKTESLFVQIILRKLLVKLS